MNQQVDHAAADKPAKSCCVPSAPAKPGAVTLDQVPLADGREDPGSRDMVWIEGATSYVGTDHPVLPIDGEAPRRKVRLRSYGIDRFAVTNKRFTAFVESTGFVTEAEQYGWSFVFWAFVTTEIAKAVPAAPEAPWWLRIEGACWKHPEGPGSDVDDRVNHPVVHVSWRDARAFAAWAGGRLPSEAEWEHAARGPHGGVYPWGDRNPDDHDFFPCNIWQGHFPDTNLTLDGHAGTAPVDTFEPNGFGLYNMVGNAWEWCEDPFRVRSLSSNGKLRNQVAKSQQQRLMKGGSYLCHQSYCHRYRIAARLGCPPDSGTGHVGFRLAYDREGKSEAQNSPLDRP
ncbi:formylglycine-generating enzyme family protein [Hoeflea sp. G2-23]|uniref:Formylglycine-generating enzyme family protein n=1 Tax=Hoeflea algicola TaxID=2983763 RepID=A0ABT3ZF07_9HYPH|nr:formylglycine-generating enzyme family protein [Hoeflea algicola]MCY0150386.1 formylglycine-generating enzyme family protein [Hoeflea algicola]